MLKSILITTAGALALSTSPALGKAHAQPADASNFAQGPDRGNVTDDTGVTDRVAIDRLVDARFDGNPGIDDGRAAGVEAKNRDNPVVTTPPSPQG